MDGEKIGQYVVPTIPYIECNSCHERLFDKAACNAIEKARKSALDSAISGRPISEFCTSAQAADMLGISRQALHKNDRIKHGFIFRTRIGEAILFLKESVNLFRQTGDGRFSILGEQSQKEQPEYTSLDKTSSDICWTSPEFTHSKTPRFKQESCHV